MATKKSNKKMRKAAKARVAKIDRGIMNATEAVVSVSTAAGKRWQQLVKQSLSATEPLREKQIDLFFDTKEALTEQMEVGRDRIVELFGSEEPIADLLKNKLNREEITSTISENASKLVSTITNSDLRKRIEERAIQLKDEVVERLGVETKKATKKSAKKLKKAKVAAKKKVSSKKASSKKELSKKVSSKKVSTKKVAKKAAKKVIETISVKDDLKMIHGVGPKMEKLFHAKGIKTFTAVKNTSAKELQALINEAGGIYKSYKASDWKKQATLASKGNFDKLAQLIAANKK